jgi:predicted metal-dependent phosphoesterase TrpH
MTRSAGRPLRIDCHVHTAASFDSTAPVGAVLDAAAASGLDGLVVTDHDRIDAALEARDRAAGDELVVLPGVEVSTADGHLLAVGVAERPRAGRSLAATVDAVRERGGVAVVPHPFQRSRHGAAAAAIDDCDGVETFNAHTVTGVRNWQADRFAARHGYPRFGGSDAHEPGFVGAGYTAVDATARTAEAVLAAMRDGRTRAAGSRASVRRYVGKLAANAYLRRPGVTRG